MVRKNDIIKILRSLGLRRGDTVMVHSALSGLGAIEDVPQNDPKAYCKVIFDSFDSVIGIRKGLGTLIVPAFTHDYVRRNKVFCLESSPSECGIFSEYVRKLPGSFRTLHPINSLSIIGQKKRMFKNISSSAYGINSAFDRLTKIDGAKIVYFGARVSHTTLMHHLEHLVGVSYIYNKAYFKPSVYAEGEKMDIPFFCAVRYLNGKVEITYEPLRRKLVCKNLLRIKKIGNFEIMRANISHIMKIGYEMLQEDQCVFLENKFYVTK